MQDMKIQQLPYHCLDIMNPGVAELHYLVALRTYYVVVLPVAVRLFILSKIPAKLVFAYQVVLYQQV